MFNTENPVVRDELWDRHKTIDYDVPDDEDALVEIAYRWSERCANWNCKGCVLDGDCAKQRLAKKG